MSCEACLVSMGSWWRKSIKETVLLVLEDAENGMSMKGRHIINDLREQWLDREARIDEYDKELKQIAKENDVCVRLLKWLTHPLYIHKVAWIERSAIRV